MIYIPTLTTKLRNKDYDKDYDYVLYSPNIHLQIIFKGKKITLWDNYTFYLKNRLRGKDKQFIAFNHYLWLINFIKKNYEQGITLITPDVDWLANGESIEHLWNQHCKDFPQLYVPNTWKTPTDKLNIVGHALRSNMSIEYGHPKWTHCFKKPISGLTSELQTYDATCSPIVK